jgi:PAS domain S-box-containing protein
MSKNFCDNNHSDITRCLIAQNAPKRHRPVLLFIKVGLVIILCQAVTMAILQVLELRGALAIMLAPVLLTVISTSFLYKLIVKPMSEILEISEKAQSNLSLFRGLLDKSNDAIFIIDPGSGKFVDVNYRACITLGYSREELLNMNTLNLEDIAIDNGEWIQRVKRISENGHIFMESRHKRKDKSTFPVEVNYNFINLQKQDYIVAVARDVSEREFAKTRLKESETKFRKLAECAKNAMLAMGPNGEISFWNPAAERIFGYSANEAMGKDLHGLLIPERFREAFKKGFAEFQKTGKGYAAGKTLKLAAIKKDGSEFKVEVTISPVHINNEWHAVGIIRDDSGRIYTDEDLMAHGKKAAVIG